MANFKDRVFVGVGGHVVAVDSATGTEVWRTKVKGQFVTVSFGPTGILVGAGGELFCLDPSTGSVLWRNKLKGLGLGVVAFADSSAVVAEASAQSQAANSGG